MCQRYTQCAWPKTDICNVAALSLSLSLFVPINVFCAIPLTPSNILETMCYLVLFSHDEPDHFVSNITDGMRQNRKSTNIHSEESERYIRKYFINCNLIGDISMLLLLLFLLVCDSFFCSTTMSTILNYEHSLNSAAA